MGAKSAPAPVRLWQVAVAAALAGGWGQAGGHFSVCHGSLGLVADGHARRGVGGHPLVTLSYEPGARIVADRSQRSVKGKGLPATES